MLNVGKLALPPPLTPHCLGKLCPIFSLARPKPLANVLNIEKCAGD